jgi:hypothetical protein
MTSQIATFRVKKEPSLTSVTIADSDTGFVLLKKILLDKKLTISNIQNNIKIHRYDAIVSNDNTTKVFLGKSEKISKNIIAELLKTSKSQIIRLSIFNIVAFNNSNETVPLNDIRITILK